MKKQLALSAIVILVFSLSACLPQEQGSNGVLGQGPTVHLFSEEAVSTSLDDSLPIESWLNTDGLEPTSDFEDLSQAGYYRYDTRSYCLHAGKHGPSSGEGYLIGPLKGSQAGLIKTIVNNSHQNRDIPQSDIQRIIWAIEAGTSLSEFSGRQAEALARLSSSRDLAQYELDVQTNSGKLAGFARSLLPREIQETLDFYENFSSLLTDATASFEEIEKLAVLSGVVEPGPGSKNVGKGNWAKIGKNLFLRSFPQSYSKTTVELLRLNQHYIEADELGRIVVFESEGHRQEVSYDDNLQFVTAPDGKQYPYWNIAELKIIDPDGESTVIKDAGWIIPSDIRRVGSSLSPINADKSILAQGGHFQAYKERVDHMNAIMDQLGDFYASSGKGDLSQGDINNVLDMGYYQEGISEAMAAKGSFFGNENPGYVERAVAFVACLVAKSCDYDPSQHPSEPPAPSRANYSNSRYAPYSTPSAPSPATNSPFYRDPAWVSLPGNTNRQRLYTDWGFGKY